MSDADWIAFDEALTLVLDAAEPLETERVALSAALGRSLACAVEAVAHHPPWDNSAMDGFAVRMEEVRGASPERPVILPISDDIPAGAFPRGPLEPGSVARVMTGAPVPEGATGVVRVEHTDGGPDGLVTIFDDADGERHIRFLGEDVKTGDTMVEGGEELGAAAVALVASAGLEQVEVGRRPRVGVLANGDELADFDEFDEVRAGRRIMNSNGHALAAQLADSGAEPVPLGIARDDPADLHRCLARAGSCDAIVSAAGVSVGEHDYVKRVLDELGFERAFWRVRMRPGSATVFGLLDNRPFWGLPGNPASALVTYETLVRPAIRKLAGFSRPCRRPIRCVAAHDLRGPRNVLSFLRVLIDATDAGELAARLSGPQGSGNMGSMLADGLLALPVGIDAITTGDPVDVLPLREWASPA